MNQLRAKVLVLDIEFSTGERERRFIEWGETLDVGPRSATTAQVIPIYRRWRTEVVHVRVYGPEVPVLRFSEVDPSELATVAQFKPSQAESVVFS